MIMDLKDLQQNFKRHLFRLDSPITQHIASDALSSEFRLGIYADAYVSRLLEALQNDYPALQTLLGGEAFYELGEAYIRRFPSTYASLRWFGGHLPIFIKETVPYNRNPWLMEMAVFEWALVDAFNASDKPSISENDVGQIPPEQWPALEFVFHPSVQSFEYRWNILPIWQAHKESKSLPKPEKLSQSETCLVWRQNLKTLFRTLDSDEALMFAAARQGANFSQLCEQLSAWIDDAEQVPLRAVGLLKTWLSQGLISDLKY